MSLQKALLTGAAVALISGAASAAEPVKLTDNQMDEVTAGFFFAQFSLNAGLAGTKGVYSKFGSSTSLGTANIKEQSSVKTSIVSSVTENSGGFSASSTETANAKASISGNFSNVSWGKMKTGGTFAIAGQASGELCFGCAPL